VTLPNDTQVEYVVDGQNRRMGKKVNGVLVQGFLYIDALHPVAELDGAGALVARFIYATTANVPDYMEKDGATYHILSDHVFLRKVASGSTIWVGSRWHDFRC